MATVTRANLPVWQDVDVLVAGAGSGAVAAALEIRRRGRTVMAVCERSYFGEESAGALHLWHSGLDRSDALVAAMFPQDSLEPATPARVKHALEMLLVRASVPFLYMARPVALLRDASGAVAGAVIAARTALFVVRCRAMVDATRYGAVVRLTGMALARRPARPLPCSWTVIAQGPPPGWNGRVEELTPSLRMATEKGEESFAAYRLWFDRAALGGDPRVGSHPVRALLSAPNVLATADILCGMPPEECVPSGEPPADAAARLSDAAFASAPGLFLQNGLLPLSVAGALELERPDAQAALGRRVGALAAGAAAARSPIRELHGRAFTGGGLGGDYRFAPAFLRSTRGNVEIDALTFAPFGRFDVLVAGGGIGGVPAGIAAARSGAKALVVEAQSCLGGAGTVGLITTYWFGNRVGFTSELDREVQEIDAESRKRGGEAWRPELKTVVFHRMLRAAGGSAWLDSYAFGVRMRGDQVDGVLVSTPFGCGLVEADATVDATGNADIAAAAGAPCRLMDAEHLAVQGTGLSPRDHPGTRYQNSDHAFVDDTDPEGVTAAFLNARAKFTASFDTSPMVNSRERRQIRGDCEVSPLDILAGRVFPDTVLTASSNFDTHGFIVHPVFMAAEPDHETTLRANVPLRCMLPRGVEGVLVTGLGMSAHRDALPVLRMQADVQNQGYAAGLAAAMASMEKRRFRDLDVRALQARLVELGILAAELAGRDDTFPLSADVVEEAARAELSKPLHAAALFAYPDRSRPSLRARLETARTPEERLDAAMVLGLMGCPEAGPVLVEAVRGRAWDEGWNYRGMGQFGPSMSRLDALILALARTRDPAAADVLEGKVRELPDPPAFSHCRVAGIAATLLHDERLTRGIAALLRRPGLRGHALLDLQGMLAAANPDPVETQARNASLRELYLARGLYLAGDADGLGRGILETYAGDLRGHYARFARAVLARRFPADFLQRMA